jgi:F-type H+-transporting ATPase subunit b
MILTAHGPIAAGDNDNAVALTHVDGSHTEAAEPKLLGLPAEGWVYVGLLIFILLAVFVGKAPRRITDALDARIAETRRQLDEARAVRSEAERLLADARARHDASAGDAAAIVAHAEQEAQALVTKAQADAADLVERRGRMAEDKIAAAERQAVADVRAQAAAAAARAAGEVIARRYDADADRTAIDRAIAGLGRPN